MRRGFGLLPGHGFSFVLIAVLLLLPGVLTAQITFEKNDTANDDVIQLVPAPPPPEPPRELTNPPGEVEWEITITNDGVDPLNGYTFFDELNATDTCHDISAAQCSALTVQGDPAVAIDCNEVTETIQIDNIDIQPGETVTITFRASIVCNDANACNQAQFCDTPACDGSVTVSRDPLMQIANWPSCITVGSGGSTTPFVKTNLSDDDTGPGPQGPSVPSGGNIHWNLVLTNGGNNPMDGVLTDDFPDEQIIDCPSLEILLNGAPHPSPPSAITCDPAGNPELTVGSVADPLLVPGQSVVEVRIWSLVDPNQPTARTCNFATHAVNGGQTLQSVPPGETIPAPTCFFVLPPTPTNVDAEKSGVDDNGGGLMIGDTITWTINLTQTGDTALPGWNLNDQIRLNQEFVPGSLVPFDSGTCLPEDNDGDTQVDNIACTDVTVEPEPTLNQLVFQTRVTCGDFSGGAEVCNQAFIDSGANPIGSHPPGDPNPAPTCLVVDIPDFQAATKTSIWSDGPQNPDGFLNEGDVISYMLTVCNDGAAASAVEISDLIPANTTYVPGSILVNGAAQTDAAGDDDGEFDGTAVHGFAVTLANGACIDLEFQVTVDAAPNGTTICNSGEATADELSGCAPQPLGPDCRDIGEPGPISVQKTFVDQNGGTPLPGDTIRYTVEICNTDNLNDITQADFSDPVPAECTYVPGTIRVDGVSKTDASGDDEAEFDGTNVLADLAPITPLDCRAVDFECVIGNFSPGTPVLNSATFQTNRGPLVAEASFNVDDVPYTLEVTKDAVDANGGGLAPGDQIDYTIQVCNTGSAVAPMVVFDDAIPANTTYVAGSIQVDGVPKTDATGDDEAEFDGTSVLADLGDLDPVIIPCSTVTFSVTVDAGVPDGTDIVNTAIATGEDGAGASSTDDALLTVAPPSIELNVTKSASDENGGSLEVGDTILYTVEVCNDGGATAPAVLMQDVIPANTAYTAGTIQIDGVPQTDAAGDDNGEFDGSSVLASLGDLDPGECVEVTFEVTVSPGTPPGTNIDNTASAATNDGAGPETDDDSAQLSVGGAGPVILHGQALSTDVPDADSCPTAPEQLPRLDPTADECPAGTGNGQCEDLGGLQWRIVGGAEADGTDDLWFTEVTGVPCSQYLIMTRDPAAGDSFASVQ